MTHTIADIEAAFGRLHGCWQQDAGASQRQQLQELKALLDELWTMPGPDSLDLRRRVRAFIDETNHHARTPTLPR